MRQRSDGPTKLAPYFSLGRALWIPAALVWDAATDAYRRVEGPDGFTSYREAVEAALFLARETDRIGTDMSEDRRRDG